MLQAGLRITDEYNATSHDTPFRKQLLNVGRILSGFSAGGLRVPYMHISNTC